MISSLSIRSYIIEYNTIDANYCFGGKKLFSLGFYNRRKKSGTEKIKVRGNRVVCQRFDEGFADKGQETDRKKISFARSQCETINNKRRPRSR